MERILSDEEKFRKAEEIYNRRRNINVTVPSKNLNRTTEKKELNRFRKMLIQIAVCICIYFTVYFIQYSNYYFSNDVIKKVEEILAYDIDFNETFTQFNNYMKNNSFFGGVFSFFNNNEVNPENMFNLNVIENTEENNMLNTVPENSVQLNILLDNNTIEPMSQDNLGGQSGEEQSDKNDVDESINEIEQPTGEQANVEQQEVEEQNTHESLGIGGGENSDVDTNDEQMRSDAQAVNDIYQITLPLRGTITSRFGDREIEPKFHTGIDIARNAGSEIISATNGTVILAEEQSSYGKVIKIQNGDLVTLYAHCSEILVNVGDIVNIMQKIAEVGSTGNSTGPHLHFEIIYCGRYVNPEYVMEFIE